MLLKCYLEGLTKYSQEELWRQNVEQRLKKRSYRDCPSWGYIPYIANKPGPYCECWEVLADRSLLCLSADRLCKRLKNTEVYGHSQPGLSMEGSQMEILEKKLKELKGFGAPWKEQQC